MQSVSSRQLFGDGYNDFFRDAEGRSIKFRIQPGISSSLRTHLEDGITSHGGVVINKIPVRGVVVIDPNSRAGKEIVCEWEWKERPGRFFVPFTFILQCIDEARLLPIEENTLQRKQFMLKDCRSGIAEVDLPGHVKDKLALHLAEVFPNECGKRSSNNVYRNIINNKHLYPWAEDRHWKTLRNSYCKNKTFYDTLISSILKGGGNATKSRLSTRPLHGRRRSLVAKKIDNNLKPSIIEVVLPSHKNDPTHCPTDKKVKFGKTFLIERKRKFGSDLTNAEAKKGSSKRLRTIDEMLKAPLPAVVAERMKKVSSTKRGTIPSTTLSDAADAEIGRARSPEEQRLDVWIDDGLFGDRPHGTERKTAAAAGAGSNAPESDSLDRFHESLRFYRLDLDDLRSAAALDMIGDDSDEDAVDETSVLELLRIPAAITNPAHAADSTIATHQTSDPLHFDDCDDPESIAVRELAERTRFTVEEVEQKFAGFSRDMNKTRDFFLRCRRLVDDLFIGSSTTELWI